MLSSNPLDDETLGINLGLPRDLDGDGDATHSDVRETAGLLPVVIRLSWSGVAGESSLEHAFYVSNF